MRKKYIEYLRVLSMFAVIAIHACIAAMNTYDNGSMFARALYLSIRNVFHFAVPVFFMMSGALLLIIRRVLIKWQILLRPIFYRNYIVA